MWSDDFRKWTLKCYFCGKVREANDLQVVSIRGDIEKAGTITHNYNYCKDNDKCIEEAETAVIAQKLEE